MKKILAMATGLLLFGATSAQAQDAPDMMQRVKVMYDLNTLSPKYGDNAYFNGVGVGYNIDFRVSNSLPVYVGTGLDFRAVFHKETIYETGEYDPVDCDVKTTLLNLNLPVNVSYRVPVADGFYLTPQLGLDFRVQVYGNAKYEPNVIVRGKLKKNLGSYDVNLFSKKEMNGDAMRRFQMGWHAAVNFEYRQFDLGLSFGTDFVKIHKNIGGSNFLVSLGYRF